MGSRPISINNRSDSWNGEEDDDFGEDYDGNDMEENKN